MSAAQDISLRPYQRQSHVESPFIRAPESPTKAFLEMFVAALLPLLAGMVFFGYRVIYIAGLSMLTCMLTEHLYYRVTRQLALASRAHAMLTGLLLALTLPAFVPWYVPVVGAMVATILGKAVFGGVGHFIWQPALIGRLAVLVLFSTTMTSPNTKHPDAYPNAWPIVTQQNMLMGDVTLFRYQPDYTTWKNYRTFSGIDAILVTRPEATLAPLTRGQPAYSSLSMLRRDRLNTYPALLNKLPTIGDVIYGSVPGAIGETSATAIVIAGLLLIWRRFVKWQLPVAIILAAGLTAAAAPIQLIGAGATITQHAWPVTREGLDVGLLYVGYQILTGGVFLVAFFLATETTTRPIAAGGQVLFGVGIGVIGMLLKLYSNIDGPFFIAVLIMNTFTPMIDRLWRPRVYGRGRWGWLFGPF